MVSEPQPGSRRAFFMPASRSFGHKEHTTVPVLRMKRIFVPLIFTAGLTLLCASALANVTITTATGGTGLSADIAQNGAGPAFTTLGNIVIAETGSGKGDIADTGGSSKTLILTAPSGWRFNSGVGSVSFTAGANITNASVSVSSSTITITLAVSGADKVDSITISGIQAQATDGG